MDTPTAFRLPSDVQPLKYILNLIPDMEKFTFSGKESIEINITKATDQIKLNAAELLISSARLTLEDGTVLRSERIDMDEPSETVTLFFDNSIPLGTASLHINFTGVLNDQLRGFYRSQYTAADGQERFLATTQFEATDARRAFPCWDEPDIKATFQVTLTVAADLVAISNMPVKKETIISRGVKAVQFADSPKMSTYLLAFIIGDFVSVEEKAPDGTLVRVWATRGKEQHGRFAVENAVKLLTYLNGYFGISYPLEKLDHVAIPDFAAGAMENWGAITYRETALLYDSENSAANTRQRILEIVSHEMAHMWFGDLVTMNWWNDLWLNESFASWMGDKAVDYLYPEWQMWTQFVSHDTNEALSLDGLRNSHPIEATINDPAEIRELFDVISYSKGGAILRMLEEFLGEASFRQGLHIYLTDHQYGNAETKDLWTALEKASGQPVTTIMDSWIKQTGYPILSLERLVRDGETHLRLTQRRFLYDHLDPQQGEEDPTVWQIPVGVVNSGTSERTSLFLGKVSEEKSMGKNLSPHDWVKVNAQQTGFYRVKYAPEDWKKLRCGVQEFQLPAVDRLGLQNDAYALAQAGYVSPTLFLSLIEAYRNENDTSVWRDLSANLHSLESLICDEPYLSQFHRFGQQLLQRVVGKMGWDAKPDEGHLDALLRSTVLGQISNYGDCKVISEAQSRFSSFVADPANLNPDLRAVVFAIVAREGDKETYNTLWELEKQATLHEEKLRILTALTRFRQKDLLQSTLQRSLSSDVRSQDTVLVITALSAHRYGRDLAWEFVKSNWTELDRRYGGGGFAVMRLVSITESFTSIERATDVEEFFKEHPVPSAQRTIQQSLERIYLNAKWLDLNRKGLSDWFSTKS